MLVQYHPDVRKERESESDGDSGVQFQRINVAYQVSRTYHLSFFFLNKFVYVSPLLLIDLTRSTGCMQMVMRSMREADERLEYWRLKYGLTDEDLDRYRHHLNQEDGDDWFDM